MVEFPRVTHPISYTEFYRDYLLPNRPCVLDAWITDGWLSRQVWSSNGKIDIKRLLSDAPNRQQLCVADCSRVEFDAHPVLDMSADEFLVYWQQFHLDKEHGDQRSLYLKDWHYFKNPNNRTLYTVPELFSSDWMNEFWQVRPDVDDDFRFVYLGTQGTWTPLHADVYRSFSWSANILGQKRWWFFPPGEEKKLQTSKNNNRIPNDVRPLDLTQLDVQYAIVDQFPGQAVFVPSGWYHQVLNVTDCVSINHNWFNASNVAWVWEHLQDQLRLVEQSTEDVRNTPGWHEQCQVCLRALTGMNFHEFLVLLKYILVTRWPDVDPIPTEALLLTSGAHGDSAQVTEESRRLLQFEQQLDVAFCAHFDRNPHILDHSAKDCRLETEFVKYTTGFDHSNPMQVSPNTWVQRLDFCSTASVLCAFCAHPVVHKLELIKGEVNRRLVSIRWIEKNV